MVEKKEISVGHIILQVCLSFLCAYLSQYWRAFETCTEEEQNFCWTCKCHHSDKHSQTTLIQQRHNLIICHSLD